MATATMAVEQRSFPWWLVLIQGIAAIIVGFLLLTAPLATTLIIVQMIGVYWFISGLFGVVSIFLDSTMWGLKLALGVLGILAGLAIIQHPLWSTVLLPATLVVIFGIEGLLMGGINLVQAFRGGGWGIGLLGILNIIFGIILLSNPLIGAALLPWILGIFAILIGIAAVFLAFRMR
ncbi:MAG TPA: DUF308 domain-containing protein [Anaerolineales bacterium]|nr:DUF308 domain-containing protein [Anaerolineales bacterium]